MKCSTSPSGSRWCRPSLIVVLVGCLLLLVRAFQPSSEPAEFGPGAGEYQARIEQSLQRLRLPDQRLQLCIRNAARDRAGAIDDVRDLQLLYCRRGEISDLSGLGQLSRLKFLDLSNNRIQSLGPLRGHPGLKSLHLTANPLTDIGAIASMPLLAELHLPDLPTTACGDLDQLLQGIRSNMETIACYGKRKMPKPTFPGAEQQPRQTVMPDEITDAEQRELLEFERELRYQNR